MEILSERDLQILETITQYSYVLDSIYTRLFEEEMINGPDTVKYDELLEELTGVRKATEDLYESLKITPEKVNLCSYYLITTNKDYKKYDDRILEAINVFKTPNLVDSRMLNRFEKELYRDEESYKNWIVKENLVSSEEIDNFLAYASLEKTVTTDIERAFMYFIRKDSGALDEEAKDLWNRIKYNLLFLSPNTEEEFLLHKGTSQEELTFSFPFVGEINQLREEVIINTQADEGMRACRDAITNMIHPNHSVAGYFPERDIYRPYLKAGLSILLSLNNYEEIIESLKDYLLVMDRNQREECSRTLYSVINTIDEFVENKPKCKFLHFQTK